MKTTSNLVEKKSKSFCKAFLTLRKAKNGHRSRTFPKYFVSTFGRVLSVKTGKPKFIGTKPNNWFGYISLALKNDGGIRHTNVHRVVAETFIPKPPEWEADWHVNHISGDPKDNSVSNLEWCTRSENFLHPNCNRRRSKKVRRISIEDGSAEIFLNASVAARSVGGRASNVHNKCNKIHKRLDYLGYFWEWA